MSTPNTVLNEQPVNQVAQEQPDMFDAMIEKQNAPKQDLKLVKPVGNKMTPTEDKETPVKEVATKKVDTEEQEAEEVQSKTQSKDKKTDITEEDKTLKQKKVEVKTTKEEDPIAKSKRLEKIAYDQQRFARHEQQKVKDTLKVVDELATTGDLDEETAAKLMAALKKESTDKAAETFATNITVENPQPLSKYQAVLNKAEKESGIFENYLAYTGDVNAKRKLEAFDIYLKEASEQEIDTLDEEFAQCKNPIDLLKAVLTKGEVFLEEGLGEFYEYGGFRQYFKVKKETERKLQKDIDKLSKKLLQYENTNTAGNWLGSDSSGSETEQAKLTGDMFDDMLTRQESERSHRR